MNAKEARDYSIESSKFNAMQSISAAVSHGQTSVTVSNQSREQVTEYLRELGYVVTPHHGYSLVCWGED